MTYKQKGVFQGTEHFPYVDNGDGYTAVCIGPHLQNCAPQNCVWVDGWKEGRKDAQPGTFGHLMPLSLLPVGNRNQHFTPGL